MSRRALVVLYAALLVGCPTRPPPPPPAPVDVVVGDGGGEYPGPDDVVEVLPDDSPEALASPCGRACTNLAKVGCPEGRKTDAGITCYRACVTMAQQQRLPTSCWASAPSGAAARACGGLRCLNP